MTFVGCVWVNRHSFFCVIKIKGKKAEHMPRIIPSSPHSPTYKPTRWFLSLFHKHWSQWVEPCPLYMERTDMPMFAQRPYSETTTYVEDRRAWERPKLGRDKEDKPWLMNLNRWASLFRWRELFWTVHFNWIYHPLVYKMGNYVPRIFFPEWFWARVCWGEVHLRNLEGRNKVEAIILGMLWSLDTAILWNAVDFADSAVPQIFAWTPTLVARMVASWISWLPLSSLHLFQCFQWSPWTIHLLATAPSRSSLSQLLPGCISLDFHIKYPILVIHVVLCIPD